MTPPIATARPRLRLAGDVVPDLARPVRLHGTLGRAEVGGGACFGVAVAVITH
jgi:hypothetical protein